MISRSVTLALVVFATLQVASSLHVEPPYPYKRTPYGFVGVRGKKTIEDDLSQGYFPNLNSIELGDEYDGYKLSNHWPTGIFHQQKKDYGTLIGKIDFATNSDDQRSNVQSYLNEGRLMSLLNHYDNPKLESNEVVKRSPKLHAFYGVRGKKTPFNQALVFRGKKEPIDFSFRGKFVGVRGKKSETPPSNLGQHFPGFDMGYDLSTAKNRHVEDDAYMEEEPMSIN